MTNNMDTKLNQLITNHYAIVRTHDAGVFYCLVDEIDDTLVLMRECRRIYYWKCLDDGITLSHIALGGIHPESKIQAPIDIMVVPWIEIIPATDACIATFDSQPYSKAD